MNTLTTEYALSCSLYKDYLVLTTCSTQMMFKQLLQLEAIDVCQIDSCRLGGVNEVLAVLLMSAKYGIPVCPHAGGVGLCEYVVSPPLHAFNHGLRTDPFVVD